MTAPTAKPARRIPNPYREITRLRTRIKALERDRMFARSLLLPGQIAVYRAALRYASCKTGRNETAMLRAVARALRKGK